MLRYFSASGAQERAIIGKRVKMHSDFRIASESKGCKRALKRSMRAADNRLMSRERGASAAVINASDGGDDYEALERHAKKPRAQPADTFFFCWLVRWLFDSRLWRAIVRRGARCSPPVVADYARARARMCTLTLLRLFLAPPHTLNTNARSRVSLA